MDVQELTPMTLSDIDNASSKNPSTRDDLGDVSLDYDANKDGTSSSLTKELQPLVKLETEGITEDRNQTFSCWKCKYNWRFLLPIACCCRGSVYNTRAQIGIFALRGGRNPPRTSAVGRTCSRSVLENDFSSHAYFF